MAVDSTYNELSFDPTNTGFSTLTTANLENPMGESSKDALRVVFDGSLKLEFHGSKVPPTPGYSPTGNSMKSWVSRQSPRVVCKTGAPGRIPSTR